ncbi:MAG: hypothetical protein MOB07_12315 [Acidobacteria bacterium]|nr:hypothetical protein [Acidobacteriota bacterium]
MKTHHTLLLAAVLLLPFAAGAQTPSSPQTAHSKMVIEMRTGETHLTPPRPNEGRLARWFDLQTVSISNRYQFTEKARGATTANHEQYQVTFKGRFKFDEKGRFSLNAGLFSGRNFFSGWNSSGWGSSRATSNLYLKELYLSVKPARGVELQYGSLYLLHGEATEVTAYDYDGYVMGQRITLSRPDNLWFDEISYTAGYLGDFNRPSINKRYHRLRQVNFHHVLAGKKLGERVRISADYASESGPRAREDVFRQAVKIKMPEAKIIDSLLFENYERPRKTAGYGFNVYGEKKLHRRFTLGGGYAQIDRSGLNSDRFLQGKRLHTNGLVTLTPEFSITAGVTRAVGSLPGYLPRTRLDIGINYNLLHSLKKTGLF